MVVGTPVVRRAPINLLDNVAVGQVSSVVLNAMSRLSQSAGGQAALSALGLGNATAFLEALDWAGWLGILEQMTGIVTGQQVAAAEASFVDLGGTKAMIGGRMRRAEANAQARAAARVVEIDQTTRAAIRERITAALRSGDSIDRVAADLRQTVGLHSRYATALTNYTNQLRKKGLDDGTIRMRTTVYRDRLLRARAETIARTELSEAANAGRTEGWAAAVASGALPADSQKRWILGPNPCPICQSVGGTTVELFATFANGYDNPPAHPNCTCRVVLAEVGAAADAIRQPGWEQDGTKFAGSRCAICPGDCTSRVSLEAGQVVKGSKGAHCSGLPKAAPPTAIPVTTAAECDVGDTLYMSGNPYNFEITGVDPPAGTIVAKGKGAPKVYAIDGSTKSWAVTPGPAKAAKVAPFEGTPGAKLAKGAPTGSVPITKLDQAHPGDVLYSSTKPGIGHTVIGQHESGAGVVVIGPDGKKSVIKIESGSKIGLGYSVEPGPDKWKYLIGSPPSASKPAGVPHPNPTPKPKPGVTGTASPSKTDWFQPEPGSITGHAAHPGNTYKVISVKGDKALIETASGSKFEAATSDLIGVRPGMKVNVLGDTYDVLDLTPGNPYTKVKIQKGADVTFVNLPKGGGHSIKPATATPGKGVAAGKPQAGLIDWGQAKKPSYGTAKKPAATATATTPTVVPPPSHAQGAATFASRSDGVAWGKRQSAGWQATSAEQSAIRSYTGSSYYSTNQRLRSSLGQRHDAKSKAIDAGLEKGEMHETVILTRGHGAAGDVDASTGRRLDSFQPGETFVEHGFTSTSVDTQPAFSKQVGLRIRAPAGTRGAYVGNVSQFGHAERELILAADTEFRVVARHELPSGTVIYDVVIVRQKNRIYPYP